MDTSDLSLKTLLQLPDSGSLSGNEFVHLVQGDAPADVKCTVSFLGSLWGYGLIHVTATDDQEPSMAIGEMVDWPMSWRGNVCGYYAGAGGYQTDIDLQQVPAVSPVMVAAGATWEPPDHVTAFGERAGRGVWAYSGTFLGQQAGYYAHTYAPVFVGRWAGYASVGAQINAIGYQAGAYSDGGYDAAETTLTNDLDATTTGSVAVGDASAWAPATLGYANGTLFFRIEQEVIQGHYIDDTHIGIDVRAADGHAGVAHGAGSSVLRFLPSAQNNFLGTEAGKYLWGGNNDLMGHQAGYQGSFHDCTGIGYRALYVSVGYNHVAIGSRANANVAGHDTVAIGVNATTQVLGAPFTVTTGPGNRTFDIANRNGQPSQNIAIPAGTGTAIGWTSGDTVNLLWSWDGSYAPVHLESANTAYLFTYYKNPTTGDEYLLPSKQSWYWNGSAVNDLNPPDMNTPVGGDDVASWPSPENSSITLYQPVGTATFTPILGSNETVAVGSAAKAIAQNAVSIGANSTASELNAVAIGSAASASNQHTLAIGTNTVASNNYSQAIGYGAQSAYEKSLAIGANAQATRDYQIVLGDTSITSIYANVTSITALSDRRHKKDIRDSDLGLDFITRLRPVSYRFRNGDETLRYGFIAQDVARTLPERQRDRVETGDQLLALVERERNSEGTFRLNYGELIAPIVCAIQELSDEVRSLRRRLAAIEEIR